MGEIRIAVAGVGNCCSALVQGVEYYKQNPETTGLLHQSLSKYKPENLKFVAAFDIDSRKVGSDLGQAIFKEPNKAPNLQEVPDLGVPVLMGPSPDIADEETMSLIKKSKEKSVNVPQVLKEKGVDVLVNMISGGSDKASRLYSEACLEAGCSFLNATPSSIVNDLTTSSKFKKAGIPLAGDDLMSQMGATVLHIGLMEFLDRRGVRVKESYQLDVGGGSESINTLEKTRETKRTIKTEAVKSAVKYDFPLVSGSADFVDFLVNGRDSYFWFKGTYFSGAPFTMDVKLSTEDSPNAGAVLIDVIRGLKIAKDRGVGGAIEPICSYGFKRPPRRFSLTESYRLFKEFVEV